LKNDTSQNLCVSNPFEELNLIWPKNLTGGSIYSPLFLLAFHVNIGCPAEAKGKDGRINKGKKGFPVVFWKRNEVEVEDLDSEFREETGSAPKVLHHF
jgi:hypothetical protein